MRALLLPDPSVPIAGFLKRDRINGLGTSTDADIPANPDPANTTTPGFWGTIGATFLDLTRTYAPGLINWGLTGRPPQAVVTPGGNVAVIPGGTQTMQQATGGLPPWVLPVAIGGAALLFFASRK